MAHLHSKNQDPLKALIIEGTDVVLRRMTYSLRYDGWVVDSVESAEAAVERMASAAPDVVVAGDDQEPMRLFTQIRGAGSTVPVLFLQAKDQPRDRVSGLTVGGCDVLEKSFSVEDLLSRMRGLIRQDRAMQGTPADSRLRLGDLTLDEDTFEVERGGELLELTSTEFDLLRYFMRNPGRVLSKPQLQDRVWRYDFTGNPAVVELYVSYLRKKVDTGRSPMFRTVRSAGYMLRAAS